MKILVTAGPTREPIDPVRFISNRSSGKMGYALARIAVSRAHEVVLISGPVALTQPEGVQLIPVLTAEEILAAVRRHWDWCEALIMAAAVCDWRPIRVSPRKIKKTMMPAVLKLKPTPDILLALRSIKGGRIVVGFAAETDRIEQEARRKLQEKNLDLIVANDVGRSDAGFEVDTNQVTMIPAVGEVEHLSLMSKDAVAERILQWIEARYSSTKTCTKST